MCIAGVGGGFRLIQCVMNAQALTRVCRGEFDGCRTFDSTSVGHDKGRAQADLHIVGREHVSDLGTANKHGHSNPCRFSERQRGRVTRRIECRCASFERVVNDRAVNDSRQFNRVDVVK